MFKKIIQILLTMSFFHGILKLHCETRNGNTKFQKRNFKKRKKLLTNRKQRDILNKLSPRKTTAQNLEN